LNDYDLSSLYGATVVSEEEKRRAKEMVKELKERYCSFHNAITLALQMYTYHLGNL